MEIGGDHHDVNCTAGVIDPASRDQSYQNMKETGGKQSAMVMMMVLVEEGVGHTAGRGGSRWS